MVYENPAFLQLGSQADIGLGEGEAAGAGEATQGAPTESSSKAPVVATKVSNETQVASAAPAERSNETPVAPAEESNAPPAAPTAGSNEVKTESTTLDTTGQAAEGSGEAAGTGGEKGSKGKGSTEDSEPAEVVITTKAQCEAAKPDENLYVFHGLKKKYHDALEYCESNGGTLSSVLCDAEQNFIFEHFGRKEYWVGGNDIAEDSVFVWEDGSAFDY